MSSPLKGFYYFISGIGLIFKPGIFRYAIWPIIINVVIFALVAVAAYFQFERLLDWLLSYVPGWLNWLRYLLWPVFVLAIAFVFFFSFTLLANLVAAPFNAPLANAVELYLGKVADTEVRATPFVRSAIKSLGSEVRKMLYFLLRAVPLLLLFVIPVINIVAPFLWIIFSAWLLSLEYADYPMGNHELDFKAQHARLKQKRFLSLGFGATITLAFLVPVINLLVMPAAVAGATKMWVEELSTQK